MILMALSAALAFAVSAAADEEFDSKETREVQAKFSECVVKKNYAAARQMVLTPNLEDRDWRRTVSRVGDGDCLLKAAHSIGGVEMKFPLDTMRYALADALVRREFSAGSPPSIKDAAPLEQPEFDESKYQLEPGKKPKKGQLEKLEKNRDKRIALIFLNDFGECVARANPGKSHELLIAQPDTPGEGAAFNALMPEFASCLSTGQQLKFNRATLRGTIALNYYRLAHAPRVAASPAGASK